MSTYAEIKGYIVYDSKESYDNAVKYLCDRGWVKDGQFVDEVGSIISSEFKDLEPEHLTINIPYFCHRNLIRSESALLIGAIEHYVQYVCTDGCEELGTWGYQSFSMEEYAKEHGLDARPDDGDDDQSFEDLCEWQAMVRDHFFD